MSETLWRKLSIAEIDFLWNKQNDPNAVLNEIVRAYQAGATFQFGIDRIVTGYRLTIRSNPVGIYLTNKVTKARRESKWPGGFIIPDEGKAGSVNWKGQNYVIFYLLPERFDWFCREAEQIFKEYFFEGNCFRMIPNIWFDDMLLVQFVRERLRPHPAMKFWFEPDDMPADIIGWSRKFDQ
jgi:hypothetical protein